MASTLTNLAPLIGMIIGALVGAAVYLGARSIRRRHDG